MKTPRRIVICGHVDHGKSTLLGRLLTDTGQVFEERVAKVQRLCQKNNQAFEYAFLLDAFAEEQGQGITIDKTEITWRHQGADFLFIDTPGHKEFLKNMVSGASTAEAAIMLLDAQEGVREQFRRHARILKLLGIQSVIVAINKMDLVAYAQASFQALEAQVRAIVPDATVLPLAAFHGENLLTPPAHMPWYQGPTLTQALLNLPATQDAVGPTRFSLQGVYKFDHRRIYAGPLESGALKVGDTIHFLPSGSHSKIKTLESWQSDPPSEARAFSSIGFTLEDPLYLERGEIGFTDLTEAPTLTHRLKAALVWTGPGQLTRGQQYQLKLAHQSVTALVETLHEEESALTAEFKLTRPLACDAFSDVAPTGRFVLVENHQVRGGGIILNPNTVEVFQEAHALTAQERSKLYGHKGAVVWLTGLSGAGKSTLARALEARLALERVHTLVLDGDNLRHGLNRDLGFTPEDRRENIRRTAEVARLSADAGMVTIAALISPLRADRQQARALMGDVPFLEVFLDCPLSECERRDSKGLYRKARRGEIKGFTGIDAAYEAPEHAELVLDTKALSVAQALEQVLALLRTSRVLSP